MSIKGAIWLKQGVCGDLNPICRRGFKRVAEFFWEREMPLYVTSIRDGNHNAASCHYLGLAFDCQHLGFEAIHLQQWLDHFEPNWLVIKEGNHFHIQKEN